jgi:Helicase conserved C-terminal domain
MTAFLLVWPSVTLAEMGDPRPRSGGARPRAADVLATLKARVAAALAPLTAAAPADGPIDRRWYWAAPLFLDEARHPALTELLLAGDAAAYWEGDAPAEGFVAHLAEARSMIDHGPTALGRAPEDLAGVLAEVALGGPAPCALRALGATTGLPLDHEATIAGAAQVASRCRAFFNAPEATATVVGKRPAATEPEDTARYWRDIVQHAIDGNLQAVFDEHAHILRDWLGHLDLGDEDRSVEAVRDVAAALAGALDARTSTFRVDVPRRPRHGREVRLDEHRMRTRFAVAFGNRALAEGGEARAESVSIAFNSPFWPFVLTTTSVGQEGLDFHLWCHAVVHWNLPANPVDLEQREGRVHRYKCHAVRRNIAATLGAGVFADGLPPGDDPWDALFARATAGTPDADGEMVPYWVFHQGPAKIERHVPVLPFSRESVTLPQLRKALAAYRLAFGQPRQDELLEFLGATRSDDDLLRLASKLRIDLTPPGIGEASTA